LDQCNSGRHGRARRKQKTAESVCQGGWQGEWSRAWSNAQVELDALEPSPVTGEECRLNPIASSADPPPPFKFQLRLVLRWARGHCRQPPLCLEVRFTKPSPGTHFTFDLQIRPFITWLTSPLLLPSLLRRESSTRSLVQGFSRRLPILAGADYTKLATAIILPVHVLGLVPRPVLSTSWFLSTPRLSAVPYSTLDLAIAML
jgi:hypothetical protein